MQEKRKFKESLCLVQKEYVIAETKINENTKW